jgi:antitoxin component of MazEF toxin-antitoxin module
MKLALRRVGNSLGVIVPKPSLDAWGLSEGDHLELTDRGIQPEKRPGFSHQALDELKRAISLAVLGRFTAQQIRAQVLANLYRWQAQGAWVSAYDEWRALAQQPNDDALYAAMLGRDDNAVRLRQSLPYVGLLSQAEVAKLHEEAAA